MSSERTTGVDRRPVNLALWTMKFPITAIISILHRLTGFFLFLLIPIVLYAWQFSISSEDNFNIAKSNLDVWYVKLLVWTLLVALAYHIVAGVRHLLMDMHIGDSKQAGKISSYIVLGLITALAIFLGVYLW